MNATEEYQAFLDAYSAGEQVRREVAWKEWVYERTQSRAQVRVVYEDGTPDRSESMPYLSAELVIAREISGCGHHFVGFGDDERRPAGFWRGRRVLSARIAPMLD